MDCDVTVVITTKDRCDELRRAVNSVFLQEPRCKVLIFDDGSSDGTSEMVRGEFPEAKLVRTETPLGIVAARNAAIGLCDTKIVVTIDDDCIMQSPATVRQTILDFDHPLVAAVAIPYHSPTATFSNTPQQTRTVVSEFTGCANAVVRDIFLALGGFHEELWRQTEEYDFCTRALGAGFVIRRGNADPIIHCESLVRNHNSIVFYNVRNHLLYAWRNIPGWRMPLHAAVMLFNTLRAALSRSLLRSAVAGLFSGIRILLRGHARQPVSVRTYRLMRRLRKQGPLPLDEVLAQLRLE